MPALIEYGVKTLEALIAPCCGSHADHVDYMSRGPKQKPDEDFKLIPRIPELAWQMSAYESGRKVDPSIIATLDILSAI